MGFRNVIVAWFGERVAQRIEQFVETKVFGDEFVLCPACGRPVASAYICERLACPVCCAAAGDGTVIRALEARRRAAQSAADAAIKETEEIERRLTMLRKEG